MFRSLDQERFSALISQHIATGSAPLLLEGGTGLGKTRAYLHALVQSGQQVAIVLPTHQLIDQLLASSDLVAAAPSSITVVAFRPVAMHADRAAFDRHRAEAAAAQVLVCTAASIMIDQRLKGAYNGATLRDYLVFDEADQLPDLAALQADLRIARDDYLAAGVTDTSTAHAVVATLLTTPAGKVAPEVRAAARIIQEAMDDPESGAYAHTGFNGDGDVVLLHRLPGRLLKRISNQSNVAFISATLSIGGRFQDFQRAMGIATVDPASSLIEPLQHGKLTFLLEEQEVDTPEWLESIAQAVASAPKPALVVTPSHELALLLGSRLPGAVVRDAEETTSVAATRVAPDGVLVAAAAWAGLDTPLRWRSIIVPRVPYPMVQTVDNAIVTSYLDSRNTAVRRLRQVIGRGLRTPDAECQVVLLDARATRLTGYIPVRFQHAWDSRVWLEGGRKPVGLSEKERDPRVRAAALRHYGRKCMALGCTFEAKVDSQLEVHHRNPIAEGKRQTKLEDVMVLCACCHRLAHTRTPPYQLDIEGYPG